MYKVLCDQNMGDRIEQNEIRPTAL